MSAFDETSGRRPVVPVPAASEGRVSKRPGLSLKARAVRYLAAREHSRVELARKLAPYAPSEEALARVLDDLESAGLLSLIRFAQSVAFRRSGQFGARRIEQELRAHAVDAAHTRAVLEPLRCSEIERVRALWERRFAVLPQSMKEYARQHRFFVQRGFAPSAIQAVLRGTHASAPGDDAVLPGTRSQGRVDEGHDAADDL